MTARFYRNFEGEERCIEAAGLAEVSGGVSIRVWAHGVQHDDGRIDDGTTDAVFGAPGISVEASTGRTP